MHVQLHKGGRSTIQKLATLFLTGLIGVALETPGRLLKKHMVSYSVVPSSDATLVCSSVS